MLANSYKLARRNKNTLLKDERKRITIFDSLMMKEKNTSLNDESEITLIPYYPVKGSYNNTQDEGEIYYNT